MKDQIKKLKEVVEYLELVDDEIEDRVKREYFNSAHFLIETAIDNLEKI